MRKRQVEVRRLAASDSARINCTKGRFGDPNCTNNATVCETVRWQASGNKGISFFYFCDGCHSKQIEGLKQIARS
jgi:hypothetical protein